MYVTYILLPPFIPIVAYDESITLHLASKTEYINKILHVKRSSLFISYLLPTCYSSYASLNDSVSEVVSYDKRAISCLFHLLLCTRNVFQLLSPKFSTKPAVKHPNDFRTVQAHFVCLYMYKYLICNYN